VDASGTITGTTISGTSLRTIGDINASGTITGTTISGTSIRTTGDINASGNLTILGDISCNIINGIINFTTII
jgi:predicted acyltransferase (DUF342 family)